MEAPQLRKVTGHTAGTIEERVGAIHQLLKDPEISLLMAYWGGANTNQILPHLDYNLFAKYPKPVIGFSDTTALLLAVNKLSGEPFDYTFKYFKQLLIEGESRVRVTDSHEYADDLYFLREDSDHRIMQPNLGRKVYRHGLAKGEIVAANLQTLLVLAGTDYFPDLAGKVLFVEEAEDVSTSMVHRFFTHLSQCVELETLAAVCIWRFASQTGFCADDSEQMLYDDVFGSMDIPVIYNLDLAIPIRCSPYQSEGPRTSILLKEY